jgi:hypothetical protein
MTAKTGAGVSTAEGSDVTLVVDAPWIAPST